MTPGHPEAGDVLLARAVLEIEARLAVLETPWPVRAWRFLCQWLRDVFEEMGED
jgi:hypothetical protein